MQVILGVDVGGSTTKIVGFKEDKSLIGTLQVRAGDQMTSLYGAIGNFLRTYGLSLKSVAKIVLTGVGASFVHDLIYDIPTYKVKEFEAIGWGGLYLADKAEALVVSMGTGTAFVRASHEQVTHIGGSGVGGGTLLGLSTLTLNERDSENIIEMAKQGDLAQVDLLIRDISEEVLPSLPPDLTASNFGFVKKKAMDADIALGLINMIFQTIGMMAVFACQSTPIKEVILTGTLATLPQAKPIFATLSNMHATRFIIPEHAVFATAIGAVQAYL